MPRIFYRPLRLSIPLRLTTVASAALWLSVNSYAGPILFFQTVVNNNDLIPGTEKNFNSYNQPSINANGLVVFRARSRGGEGAGQPASGIFIHDMSTARSSIIPFALRGDLVSDPNNTGAIFNEFPSIPRIDANSGQIATRGQSRPVLEYQVGVMPGTGEPETTRLGTSGIYTNPRRGTQTGMSGLGNVNDSVYPANPDLSYFQVPNTTPATRFEQFPGAPSPTGGDTVVFKGNWSDPDTGGRRTGVYFRNVLMAGGTSSVQLVADSQTDIPDHAGTTFGSTAPPSAASNRMVFLGVDNEAAPTMGGIYMAELDDRKDPDEASLLKTIVSIGQAVVGKVDEFFNDLGEALSFDGQRVGFWGAWGDEKRAITVSCDSIENNARRIFCFEQDDGSTPGSGAPGDGNFMFDVAVNQGFFIADVNTLETRLVAETGIDFLDFLYWNFSGKVPGAEDEEDGEVARWRSSSFLASDGWNAVFKGTPTIGEIALYLLFADELSVVAQVGMDGSLLDPEAIDEDGNGLPVVALGIERDGYRNGQLAISASMTDGRSSMAGIYSSGRPAPAAVPALGREALALLALSLLLLARRYLPAK